jgi:hypothetical protein
MQIQGSWSGWYGYSGKRLPTQFDIDFMFNDPSNFMGRIFDNGPMGEAMAPGAQMGQNVTFTKTYVDPLMKAYAAKVYYTGWVSDDGNYMHGTWKLGRYTTGPWEAYRAAPNQYVPVGTVWPPPPVDYVAFMFERLNNLEPMTISASPSRLVLTKRHPAELVGMDSQITSTCLMLLLLALWQVWRVYVHVQTFGFTADDRLIPTGIMFAVLAWSVTRLAPMIRMAMTGNVYVLDRAGNKLTRNGTSLGRMNEINCVELKTTGASRVTHTVRIILNSGRRIFVETGRPDAISALASSIAQFAGVQVVGA